MGAQPAQLRGGVPHARKAFFAVAFRLAKVCQGIREPFGFVRAGGDFRGAGHELIQLGVQMRRRVRRGGLRRGVQRRAVQVVRARRQRLQVCQAQADGRAAEEAQRGRGVVRAHQHRGDGDGVGDLRDVEKPG